MSFIVDRPPLPSRPPSGGDGRGAGPARPAGPGRPRSRLRRPSSGLQEFLSLQGPPHLGVGLAQAAGAGSIPGPKALVDDRLGVGGPIPILVHVRPPRAARPGPEGQRARATSSPSSPEYKSRRYQENSRRERRRRPPDGRRGRSRLPFLI